MKKKLPLHSTTLLLLFLVVFSCTKDDPIATKGNIYGKVTEEVTGQFISGAQVTVSGEQETTTTGQDGSYQFSELPAGSYSVSVSKSGYVSDSKTLTVVPEKTTSGDFILEKDLPTLSSNALVFNNENKTATLTLQNTRSGVMNFSVESSKVWLKANPLSGAIQAFNQKIISISVDLKNVPYGNYQEYIVINVGEASKSIPVQIDYIQPPYIEITKPTADQTYKMGEVMSIEWSSNLEGTLKIELLRFSSVFQTLTSDAVNNNGGNFTWTIPAIDPAAYQLKITSLENTTIESTSDAFNIVEGPTVPMLITKNPSELTSNTIQILGEIISLGVQASKVDEHGHVYSKNNPTPTISDSRTKLGETTTIGNFTSQINNLTSGETYYIAAYAINTKGTAYGDVITLTTPANIPTVETAPITQITKTSASFGGTVRDSGGSDVIERGFCWGLNAPVTVDSNTIIDDEIGEGTYNKFLTGLLAGTRYFVKAYAKNASGVGYGEQLEFTTNADIPVVSSTLVSSLSPTVIRVTGELNNDRGAAVTSYGFVYALNSNNPTIGDKKVEASNISEDVFTADISELLSDTKYHVRAYATNAMGTAYGDALSITTKNGNPTVITLSATSTNSNFAKTIGRIDSDGGAPLTSYGFVYSKENNNPNLGDEKVTLGTSTSGTFEANISDLLPETLYYVRAFATNDITTAFGDVLEVSTKDGKPTVQTLGATSTDPNSAKTTGRIDSDGGAPLTSYGFVYSKENINPNLGDEKVTLGTSTSGTFEANISDLLPETLYYVRAFATNDITTAFGDVLEVSTKDGKPTVQTLGATSTDPNSAKTTGRIDSDGGAPLTSYGFVYSKENINPNLGDEKVTLGTSTSGTFEANISDLLPETLYYVRAFATNDITTAFGDVLEVSTKDGKPTVQTHYATTIDSNSAKTAGRIDSDGGRPLTSYGFVYSKQNIKPSLDDEKVTLGTSTSGLFEANLSELQPETTYYVRAFATNEITTAYGDVKTFTTEAGTYFGFDTPREGAELEAGSIFDITWSTNLSKRIILELWKDGNYEFEISNNVQASATSFSFNIPITQEVASHYTLRAVDYDSNEVLGTSKMFKIVGLLRLVAPVQDTEHFIEEGVEVSWYSNYNTQFKIELYKGSQFLEELANNVDSNDEKYTLVREDSDHKYVGDDNYRIKLTDLTTNQIKYSGYFSVFEESTGLKFHNNDIKKTVTINGKRWTAEDVRLAKYLVICIIQHHTGYDNVPSGWRVASNEDWKHLEASLGMINSELSSSGDRTTGNVGFKLKTVACGGIDSYQFNASCEFPYGVSLTSSYTLCLSRRVKN